MLVPRSFTFNPMWSYMPISSICRRQQAGGARGSGYGARLESILENLALPACRLPELPRRDSRGAAECADEVREVAEADLEGDVRDGTGVIREQPRGIAESGAHEVLMGRDARYARERAQEMKG